jgi:hypothetical protein
MLLINTIAIYKSINERRLIKHSGGYRRRFAYLQQDLEGKYGALLMHYD